MIRRIVPVVVLAAALLCWAGTAAAHDDEGVLTVDVAEPAGDLTVDFQVNLIYSGDREPVEDASLTAVAEGPAGTAGPFTLDATEEPGRYATTITFPAAGDWVVRFTSITPGATVEHPLTVAGPATTTTVTPPTTAESAEPTSTLEVEPVLEDDRSDSSAGTIAAALVVATVIVLGGALYFRRARRG